MRQLSPKLKDPGSFIIPCRIGKVEITKALCDLGASMSLIPLCIFSKLGIKELSPIIMTLQLADKSTKLPLGVAENVLVNVKGSLIPTDFVVLDMEEDKEIPLILVRPFLATAGAVIDVKKGSLSLNIGGVKIEFGLKDFGKFSDNPKHALRIDDVTDDSKECIELLLHEKIFICRLKFNIKQIGLFGN